jgi:hypothetical protein
MIQTGHEYPIFYRFVAGDWSGGKRLFSWLVGERLGRILPATGKDSVTLRT